MTDIQSGARVGVAEVYNRMYTNRLVQTTGVHQLDAGTQQVFGVIVQNDPDSANDVHVGNATAQYFELVPGASVTIPIDQLAKIYVAFTAAATVNYIAMG
jgi:hypothetical protein